MGEISLEIFAQAELPTQFGSFTIVAFSRGAERIDDVAIVRGDLRDQENVPTRLHSECLTGDVFHSLRCDCRQQLEAAQRHFAQLPKALILYMRQEGRGIGLANKIAAYHLQEQGLDTVDANIHLGFDDDLRSYDVAAAMIRALGVKSIDLYTNNPRKIDGLRSYNIVVSGREPIIIEPNEFNDRYLRTKQQRSGHLLNLKS
ncbi:MAG: GTP cyclohydrolase II [Proteobacteria bacterium]|nr:GTP cyclohydrolase II [Pseudomonadota bacterium]MBQ9243148.1 GTP cyclohydrolase II [Pseudomonadota bacterium]